MQRAKCDPNVAEVNFFGFFDDRDRRGFQAALHRVDGTPRPAAEAVRAGARRTRHRARRTATVAAGGRRSSAARAPQVRPTARTIVVSADGAAKGVNRDGLRLSTAR